MSPWREVKKEMRVRVDTLEPHTQGLTEVDITHGASHVDRHRGQALITYQAARLHSTGRMPSTEPNVPASREAQGVP